VPNAVVNRTVINGWQATLRATSYQGRLIIGVTFIASAPANHTDVPEATARLSLPGTREQVFIAGTLDKSPITLRGDLPRIPGAKRVQAEVSIGGARGTLRIPAP
jgi:hypothetical protein